MSTITLLLISNTFMTLAWYGHLKYKSAPLIVAIVASWLIAFGEYCFQVPANRIGYARTLLELDDAARARPVVERLLRERCNEPELLALARQHSIGSR